MADQPSGGFGLDPLANFRFGVFFFAGGLVPNPVDIRFQSVSGLAAEVATVTHREGGEQLHAHRLPDAVGYGNLVLKRGVTVGSPLGVEFDVAMGQFRFSPSNVLVTVLGEDRLPRAAWLFVRAWPAKWQAADLAADGPGVLIETMELAYARMQPVRV